MESTQKQRLAELAASLYAKKDRADRVLNDVVSAVSLLGLTREREFERCVQALHQCAERDGLEATKDAIGLVFFRLGVNERMALMGTHIGKLSYRMLTQVLMISEETRFAEILWSARQNLLQTVPTGSRMISADCPEFIASRPWTQSFLDEEIKGTDRLFLETHMKKCDECREALFRARQFVFQADRILKEMSWEWPIVRVRPPKRTFEEVTVQKSVQNFVILPQNLIWVLVLLGLVIFLVHRVNS